MNAERWNRIADCYHAAVERPASERAEFVARECAGDPELQRELESLLAHEGGADSLLEKPAWPQAPVPSALAAGSAVGIYRIVGELGCGGMGEVYRASDTKLDREVALKLVAPEFASDAAWLERFRREARLLARLNHAHIAAIYGLEESGGHCAIAMELVEGVTLASRLANGRIPTAEALIIARQIAAALEYSHEEGIVHRDLKPANVKLRPDGVVKVLDFGLAKSVDANGPDSRTGMVMGTPAYMAPEQAAGKPVDRRADIWAFGVVLFEMLTGRALFARATTAETLATIMRDDPPWPELPAGTPAEAVKLLRRCLDKDPRQRLRDIGEARIALEHPESAAATVRKRSYWPAAALACLALAAVSTFAWLNQRVPERPAVLFQLDPPPGTQFTNPFAATAVSPDGRAVVFGARGRNAAASLWLRRLDSVEAHPLAGTDGANLPFFSADAKSVAFFASGKLRRVELSGGQASVLCDAPNPDGGSWNGAGVILFARDDGIYRIPASGGGPTKVIATEASRQELRLAFPEFLSDGNHFLYLVTSHEANRRGIYVASLDRPEERHRLLATEFKVVYLRPRDGQPEALAWIRDRELVVQSFDSRRLRLVGEPALAASNVSSQTTARVAFWASDGLLVYRTGTIATMHRLVWIGRDGKQQENATPPDLYGSFALSPDGKRVALGRVNDGAGGDLWLYEFSRNVMTRLTFDPSAAHLMPLWSPDGRELVIFAFQNGVRQLYRLAADGSRELEPLTNSPDDKVATSWSLDGRYVLFSLLTATNASDLWLLPMKGEHGAVVPLLQTKFNEQEAAFSPDGKWIAYQSNETGRPEIYLRAFTGTALAPGKVQVSNHGGAVPRWRQDGKEIFFQLPVEDGKISLMAAEVRTRNSRLETDVPRQLFAVPDVTSANHRWAVTGDGQRFLMMEPTAPTGTSLNVVVNWRKELRK